MLEQVRADLDLDPAAFEELDRRLGRLHDLARKHRVTPETLAAQRDALFSELESLRRAGERLRTLDGDIAEASSRWMRAAAALRARRDAAARALSDATTALIAELGMGGGRFAVALDDAQDARPDPNGSERVEFLIAENAGQPPRGGSVGGR